MKDRKKYIHKRYKTLLRIHINRNKLTTSITINKAKIKKEGLDNIFRPKEAKFDDIWHIAPINDEYCLSQLKAYEIELCFINSNMKKMRKYFRKMKKLEQANLSSDNTDQSKAESTTEKDICIEPGTSFILPEEFKFKEIGYSKKRYDSSIPLQENKNINRKDV